MKSYPEFRVDRSDDVESLLRFVIRERRNDVQDWDNLPQRFFTGRKVGKVPTGSNDITPSDRVGDINYDANYLYIVVNDAGNAKWRRISLGVW